MIDTDKYEGHELSEFKKSVAGPKHSWVTHQHRHGATDAIFVNHNTATLIIDAPLLLAEVKRLREENERLRDMVEKTVGYGAYDEEYRGDEK